MGAAGAAVHTSSFTYDGAAPASDAIILDKFARQEQVLSCSCVRVSGVCFGCCGMANTARANAWPQDSAAYTAPYAARIGCVSVCGTCVKIVQKLSNTVDRLVMERDAQNQQMDALKSELKTVYTRLREQGVDLRTERKLAVVSVSYTTAR